VGTCPFVSGLIKCVRNADSQVYLVAMRTFRNPLLLGLVFVCAVSLAAASDTTTKAAGKGGPAGSAHPVPSFGARSTSILGSAWNADNSPIKDAHLRLRNVVTGRIEATTVANEAGQFTFENIEGGTYIVELISESGKVIALGHVFTIAPGETVATFVRMGTKVPWVQNFFGNAASAATSTAASQGVTALAPVARPASAIQ
jgi:hypothetical protein